MSDQLEQAMQEYELTEDDKKTVRPLAQRWGTFRRGSFLLIIRQRKMGTFRAKSKKANRVGLVGCSYHRKQKLQTHSTPIFTQRKRKKPARREIPAPPGAVEIKSSGREKSSSDIPSTSPTSQSINQLLYMIWAFLEELQAGFDSLTRMQTSFPPLPPSKV